MTTLTNIGRTCGMCAVLLSTLCTVAIPSNIAVASVADRADEPQPLLEYRWIGSACVADELTGSEYSVSDRGTVLAANRPEARALAEAQMHDRAAHFGKVIRMNVELTGHNG